MDGPTVIDGPMPRDASDLDATSDTSCARFGFVADGAECMSCGFTCECPDNDFPRSVAACTEDGCLVEGDCEAICAGDFGEALACTDTYTVRDEPDAGADAGTSCPVEGITAPIELVAADLSSPGFAVAGGFIYYGDNNQSGDHTIFRAAADGSDTPEPLWTTNYRVVRLAVGDNRAAWVDATHLQVAPLTGEEPTTVYDSGSVSPAAHILAFDGDALAFNASDLENSLYFLPSDSLTPQKVTEQNTPVLGLTNGFIVFRRLGDLTAIPVEGGTETFLDDSSSPFAVAAGHVYYRSFNDPEPALKSATVSVAPDVRTVALLPADIRDLDLDTVASDGTSAYLASHCSPLYRVRIADGAIAKLATLDGVANLQVDATHVYWVELEGNTYDIYRLPK